MFTLGYHKKKHVYFFTFNFPARLYFINCVNRKPLNYRNSVLALFTIKLSK